MCSTAVDCRLSVTGRLSVTAVSLCVTPSDVEAVGALLKRFLGVEELQRRMKQEEDDALVEEEEEDLDHSSDSQDEPLTAQ